MDAGGSNARDGEYRRLRAFSNAGCDDSTSPSHGIKSSPWQTIMASSMCRRLVTEISVGQGPHRYCRVLWDVCTTSPRRCRTTTPKSARSSRATRRAGPYEARRGLTRSAKQAISQITPRSRETHSGALQGPSRSRSSCEGVFAASTTKGRPRSHLDPRVPSLVCSGWMMRTECGIEVPGMGPGPPG